MVEAKEDALAVTMKIRRESRVAEERALAEQAASPSGELALPPPVPGTTPFPPAASEAHVAVPPPASAKPVDADTAYRRARLGIVAVVVLVLLFVWIAQRRARAA
jgi:hypothetical protein